MVESSAADSAMESSMMTEMTTMMTGPMSSFVTTVVARFEHTFVIQVLEQMATLETFTDQTKMTTLFAGMSATEMFALPESRVIQRIDDGGHQAFDGSVQVVSQILGIIEVANTRATHEV